MGAVKSHGGTIGALMALAGAALRLFAHPGQQSYRYLGWGLLGVGVLLVLVALVLNREDLFNMIKGRPFRYGTNTVFYSLVVLGIVGSINFLAARHIKRFDLTREGIHTLSAQTIQVLENLDKDVQIVAFYYATSGSRQQAEDLLDQYVYYSGHLKVRFVAPDRNPAEARAYEIEVEPTIVVSSDSGEARITQTGLTEEDLTNALIKATSDKQPAICAVTGNGEKGIDDSGADGFQLAAEALRKESFEVKEVKLLESEEALSGCDAVLIAGATKVLLPPEVEAVDKYLSGGGHLIVMVEPRTPTGLEPLLERYGLKTGGDFIVDVNPMARLLGGSPAIPVVYDYGPHEITRDFEGLATLFPTATSVETVAPTEPDVTTETFGRTSGQSWGELGDLTAAVAFDEGTEKSGPLNIAATAVKKIAGEGDAPAKEARIVLFGDSDFASNGRLMMAGNRDLFLNTMAWLTRRSDLISIRPKSRASQPVVLTAGQSNALLFYSLLVLPGLMIVLGIGVHLRRRRL